MSRVILEAVADKGARHRVSLPTLKKAVTAMGYNMARNAWRFKRVLKGLVDKGMLKQVTGRGLSGSFRIGKKQASKSKPKLKRRQPLRRQRPGHRQPGHWRPGHQRPRLRKPRQHRSPLGSRQGHKCIRRVARCRGN